MTLRERLQQAEKQLISGPHPDRARLDAESLAIFVSGKNRAWLLANAEEEVPANLDPHFSQLLARRAAGEPIQYITGQVEFYGLQFAVAPGVLIPRPETEHLVEEVLRLAHGLQHPRIADIGTGSGAIAVALAHKLTAAQIAAVDLSPQALQIAGQNAERNHVAERITFHEGDLLAPLAGQQFDFIVSNPPYVPLADCQSLSVEVREYEPSTALFAGDDGLAIYRRLIPEARKQLVPGGWLVMEIGHGQQPAINQLLHDTGYAEIHFVPDYQGIPRVACARRV